MSMSGATPRTTRVFRGFLGGSLGFCVGRVVWKALYTALGPNVVTGIDWQNNWRSVREENCRVVIAFLGEKKLRGSRSFGQWVLMRLERKIGLFGFFVCFRINKVWD